METILTQIQLAGNVSIQIAMLRDGNIVVSLYSICEIFGIDRSIAFEYFDDLLQKEITLYPFEPSEDMAMSVSDFKEVLVALSLNGNKTATDLIRSLLGLSLDVILSDAYDVRFSLNDWRDSALSFNLILQSAKY
jgi:hypothetical protein